MKSMLYKTILYTSVVMLTFCSCTVNKNAQASTHFSPKSGSTVFPQPIGYVNDFEDILSKKEEKALSLLLLEHEKRTTDQITVVTITSIDPYETLKEYTTDLAAYWRLGDRSYNGVLIALGKDLRQIRISNGSGIVKRLSDEKTQEIIDKIMIPEFKNDLFFTGLSNGINAIIEELN